MHEIDPQGLELHLEPTEAPLGLPCQPLARPLSPWHLHFRLYKEGMDTLEALARLGRQLRRPPRHFRFAGHKDRAAVTVQRVSCKALEPEVLLKAQQQEAEEPWDIGERR